MAKKRETSNDNYELFRVTYTNKDIMDKLESIIHRLDAVHTQACITNGKVKIHTKLIYGAYGFSLTILLVVVSILVNNRFLII